MGERFRDRAEAGRRLAEAVAALKLADPVVLALPRGGVPVAAPVAQALGAPLDVVLVRKIGAPGHSELAMGAVVDGARPVVVWNESVVRDYGVDEIAREQAVEAKLEEIAARRRRYLSGRATVGVAGRDAVVVDDGIATGATARAALQALRTQGPASLTLAVPVAPRSAEREFGDLVDHWICLDSPEVFYAVGQAYLNFGQTSDEEVISALGGAG